MMTMFERKHLSAANLIHRRQIYSYFAVGELKKDEANERLAIAL